MVNLQAIRTGQDYTVNALTTLSADVDETDTEIPVVSTTGFELGSIIIAGDGASEFDELVLWTAKTTTLFQGLTRQDEWSNFSNNHTSGAEVTEWIEVTDRITDCDLNVSENGGIVAWSANMRGQQYDSFLFENDRSILAKWRFRPGEGGDLGKWTPWEVAWLGYLKNCRIRDDSDEKRTWNGAVVGLNQYVANTDVPGMRYGRVNLAANASVEVSSYLDYPAEEQGSGEFIGTPSLDGDNIVDEDMGTLWISAGTPDVTPETPVGCGLVINEVSLRPYWWLPWKDNIWIELFVYGGSAKVGSYNLSNKRTTFKWSGWDPINERLPKENFLGLKWAVGNGKIDGSDEGSFCVICSNGAAHLERYGTSDADLFIDWRSCIIGSWVMDPDADFLALRHWGYDHVDEVWFGNITPYGYDGDGGGNNWTGGTIPTDEDTLPRNHTFRKSPSGKTSQPNRASDWFWPESTPTPGYQMTGEPEWFCITLDEMGIELDAELAVDEVDEIVVTSTYGLTRSGEVKIDSEIIAYEERDDINNKLLTLTRARHGTPADVHPEGSIIEQFENEWPYKTHLVDGWEMLRKAVMTAATDEPNVIRRFEIYITNWTQPVMPDDPKWDDGVGQGGWVDYWARHNNVHNNKTFRWSKTFTPLRVRKVLVLCREMTDGGRVKLNEFKVWGATGDIEDPDDPDNPTWEGGMSGTIIKDILVRRFGLDEDKFTMESLGRQITGELRTQKTQAGSLIREMLQSTGCWLVYELDSRVTHKFNPFYPIGGLVDIDIEWDRTNARRVDFNRPFRHNVSNIMLESEDPMTSDHYKTSYPPTPLPFGSEKVVQNRIVGAGEEALSLAQLLFDEHSGPITVTLVPVGLAEWVRPGMRCTLTWDTDLEGEYFDGANFCITSVNYSIGFEKVTEGRVRGKSWTASVAMRRMELTY